MSTDLRILSRWVVAGAVTLVSSIAASSCTFPDHTFNDDEFYGRRKDASAMSGNGGAEGPDSAQPAGGGGSSGATTGTGATANAGGSGGGVGGNVGAGGGIVGKGDGGIVHPHDGGSAGSAGAPVDSGADAVVDAGPPCDPGLSLCFGVCVDWQTDSSHCGGCSSPCSGGDICKAGSCVPPCDPGLTLCSGACVNTLTDENHCGGCNKPACPALYLCSAGSCVIDCGSFTSCVPGTCTDTSTDINNCGTCQHACGSGKVCQGGVCQPNCVFPFTLCNGSCVDLTKDDANCNTCGNACAVGQSCVAGACTKLVENCQNGTDDDQDGKPDCLDPDCTTGYTCAPTPTVGWTGPIAVWAGSSGAGPSCGASGGYPSATVNASAGLVVPPYTCPACSCAPSSGMYCDDLTFVFDTSTVCTGAALDPWNAETFTPSTVTAGKPSCAKFSLCCASPPPAGGGTARRVDLELPLPSYAHGACTPSQAAPQFPPTSWTTSVLGCAAPTSPASGCTGATQCVPKPAAPFGAKLCVWAQGIPAAGCPKDYPNQNPSAGQPYYTSVNDPAGSGGRTCSACSCNPSCGGTVKTYTDDLCTAGETALNLTASNPCTNIPADNTQSGSSNNKSDTRSYTFVNAGPVCGATPSTLSGAPTPTGAITVCCQ